MADRTGQQFGNYRLTRMIGQGGYAEVYIGEHIRLNTQAAIKVLHTQLDDEYAEDFLKEARIIARLIHPHIIRIYDFDVQNGVPFLVMEYASHGTLRQRHVSGKPLPLTTIVEYTNQIAAALQYANDQGIIHRDIKPANMLVGRHKDILISDFGIALIAMSTQTIELQKIVGTPVYMAPEQFEGKSYMTSDQYSLGIIVYEWLSGKPPFQGNFYELASQHHSVPPLSLREKVPHLPMDVEQVVMTALNKDPKQRFGSMRAFANALEQASHSTPRFSTPLPLTNINVGVSNPPSQPSLPPISSPSLPGTFSPTPVIPAVSLPISDANAQSPVRAYTSTSPQTAPAGPFTQPVAPTVLGQPFEQPDQKTRRRPNKALRILLPTVLALFLAATTIYILHSVLGASRTTGQAAAKSGIGAIHLSDGEDIGLSDGTIAIDTQRTDGNLKIQAASKLKAKDITQAVSLWQQAVQEESSDAEALIYLEDQRVIASGHSYITLVVGTTLTGNSAHIGRDNLQGAYMAQKEFNDGSKLPGGELVRLLIANSGQEAQYATTVAKQIVQQAQTDKTIVGVIGWPFNRASLNAISILSAAPIPMVSPSASDNALTAISHYFFRVVPSESSEGIADAQYAEQTLHAKRAALFINPSDSYSSDLGNAFLQRFVSDGKTVAVTETYASGQSQQMSSLLQAALSAQPDLIYFAGNSSAISPLLAALPTSGPFAHLPVLGGDALYDSYPAKAQPGLRNLHFTAFAYPNEWDALGLASQKPTFFAEYPQVFDPGRHHPAGTYGYTRASVPVILAYDATFAMLKGGQIVLGQGLTNSSPQRLRQALSQIAGLQAIQGISGQIAFGPDGNPINKAVVLLRIDVGGSVVLESVKGSFLVGK